MATTTTSRPGRKLIVLGVVLVLLFGIMALTKTWKPKLGLDLRGGTTITLTANSLAGGGQITAEQLTEAKNIISQRVNGAGIGEAEITTSGRDHITVAVPGANQDSLVRQVGQTALLCFRVVYDAQAGTPVPTTPPTATPTGKPSTTPKPSTTAKPSTTIKPSTPATPNGRAWSSVLGQPLGNPDAHADPEGEHPGHAAAGDSVAPAGELGRPAGLPARRGHAGGLRGVHL